jgi:hypothetical protein
MANIYDMFDTWTNGLTTYTAIKMTVTDTTSANQSALMNLAVGGASKFFVKKDGSVGIVTATPAATLDVNGSFATRGGTVALANGRNDNITPPAFAFFRITGPTAAYQISGIANGVDGRRITLFNTVAQTLTLNNEDTNSLATNRITTLTGAAIVLGATRISTADLIYDATALRWIVLGTN